MTTGLIDPHLAQFEHRLMQDAMQQATAAYWHRRAAQFEDAKPRLGEYVGQATRADLSAAWNRCDEMAQACRARAAVALVAGVPELAVVMAEVA